MRYWWPSFAFLLLCLLLRLRCWSAILVAANERLPDAVQKPSYLALHKVADTFNSSWVGCKVWQRFMGFNSQLWTWSSSLLCRSSMWLRCFLQCIWLLFGLLGQHFSLFVHIHGCANCILCGCVSFCSIWLTPVQCCSAWLCLIQQRFCQWYPWTACNMQHHVTVSRRHCKPQQYSINSKNDTWNRIQACKDSLQYKQLSRHHSWFKWAVKQQYSSNSITRQQLKLPFGGAATRLFVWWPHASLRSCLVLTCAVTAISIVALLSYSQIGWANSAYQLCLVKAAWCASTW